jgi:hypothetical protein
MGIGIEASWPDCDAIVGNPPFLGDKKMRNELGDGYVDALRECYKGRVPGGAGSGDLLVREGAGADQGGQVQGGGAGGDQFDTRRCESQGAGSDCRVRRNFRGVGRRGLDQ